MIKKLKSTILYKKISYQLKMFKHRPRLILDSLFIRKDEFHKSLNMNGSAILDMNSDDRKKYIRNLVKRRQIAHENDFYNFPLLYINVGKNFSQYLGRKVDENDALYFRNKFLNFLDNENIWKDNNIAIELDFKNVNSIHPRWACETFGYFKKYATTKQILTKIKFSNISQIKMDIIKHEIKNYRHIK